MAQTGNDLALTSHKVPDTAAARSIQTNEVQRRQTARIVLQLGDRYMLLGSRNDATQGGDQVMRQIRKECDLAMAGVKRRRCLPQSPFWKPALSIGTMSTVITTNPPPPPIIQKQGSLTKTQPRPGRSTTRSPARLSAK
jgi:hypothetical protein